MNTKTAFQHLLKLRKKWLNKYILTLAIFLVWVLFFDKYNFFAQIRLKNSTVKLEKEYQKIKEDIVKVKVEKQELNSDQEKYGREKYFIHKDNEDVFIIEQKDKK